MFIIFCLKMAISTCDRATSLHIIREQLVKVKLLGETKGFTAYLTKIIKLSQSSIFYKYNKKTNVLIIYDRLSHILFQTPPLLSRIDTSLASSLLRIKTSSPHLSKLQTLVLNAELAEGVQSTNQNSYKCLPQKAVLQ